MVGPEAQKFSPYEISHTVLNGQVCFHLKSQCLILLTPIVLALNVN